MSRRRGLQSVANEKPPSQPPAAPPPVSAAQPKTPQVVGPDAMAEALRQMLAPIADAEVKKSEHDLEAHKATLNAMDRSDNRSHLRLMVGLIVGSLLVLGLASLAGYAYTQGDKEFASKVALGIASFLAGAASGWGAKAESASKKNFGASDKD